MRVYSIKFSLVLILLKVILVYNLDNTGLALDFIQSHTQSERGWEWRKGRKSLLISHIGHLFSCEEHINDLGSPLPGDCDSCVCVCTCLCVEDEGDSVYILNL